MHASWWIVLASLVAGCAAPVSMHDQGPLPPTLSMITAYGASMTLPEHPAVPLVLPTGARVTEPSIGITKDGTMFIVAWEDVMRSRDHGVTWQRVESMAAVRDSTLGSNGEPRTWDPWLAVDSVTDRVYVDHLLEYTAGCTVASWSDDRGDTWSPLDPVACGAPVTDYQKTVAGKPGPVANPLAGKDYPSVTYMCYNKPIGTLFGTPVGSYGTWCATSYDGGATYRNEQMVTDEIDGPSGNAVYGHCYGGATSLALAPDGAVVGRSEPDCMFRSRDSGASWQVIGKGPPFNGSQFAFDARGTLFALGYPGAGALMFASSKDQGITWSTATNILPPGEGHADFQALIAGDAGRVAVGFLATHEVIADSQRAALTDRWNAYMLSIEDADRSPRIVAYRVSHDDAPFHIGCIAKAFPCSVVMGDFVTMASSPDGTPYIVFPRTCNEGCVGNAAATSKDTYDAKGVVVGLTGWTLRGG